MSPLFLLPFKHIQLYDFYSVCLCVCHTDKIFAQINTGKKLTDFCATFLLSVFFFAAASPIIARGVAPSSSSLNYLTFACSYFMSHVLRVSIWSCSLNKTTDKEVL